MLPDSSVLQLPDVWNGYASRRAVQRIPWRLSGESLKASILYEERLAENDGVDPPAHLEITGGSRMAFSWSLLADPLCHAGHS